jgi:uncharacterized cupredoxin-like copper-binding protein
MRSHSFAQLLRTATLVTSLAPIGMAGSQQPAKPATPRQVSTATPAVTYVKVIGADYAFETQDVVPTGIVAFNLVNNGSDLHQMAVFELPDKHTLREFLDQYHSMGMIPAWMIGLGQTPTIAPKAEAFLTVRMRPGRYILACIIPARDGRMHTEKGMVKLITVK